MPEWLTENKKGGTHSRTCWGCGAVEVWKEKEGPPRPYLDWLRSHAWCEWAYAADPARFAPLFGAGDRLLVNVRNAGRPRWLPGECLGLSADRLNLYRVSVEGEREIRQCPLQFLRLPLASREGFASGGGPGNG